MVQPHPVTNDFTGESRTRKAARFRFLSDECADFGLKLTVPSGDIAERLGRKVTALAPTRNQLISKGMIWSPAHGDTAFTVPLFDEYMHRSMRGADWRE